jgi:tRNA threonylcarbamoyladenosine biosynthesis protein TsaE
MDVIYDLKQIRHVASRLLEVCAASKVFAFHGEMGSGKTTFIHALCDELNVTSVVGSPTYAIINEYEYPSGRIFHIDLYRVKDEDEALQAGVEECLYSGQTCFVEWPERASAIFPPGTVHVFLHAIDEVNRRLRIGEN